MVINMKFVEQEKIFEKYETFEEDYEEEEEDEGEDN